MIYAPALDDIDMIWAIFDALIITINGILEELYREREPWDTRQGISYITPVPF